MHNSYDNIDTLLGFVPMVGLIAFIAAALWLIFKIFPTVGERFDAMMNRLFGTSEHHDAKYPTASPTSAKRW